MCHQYIIKVIVLAAAPFHAPDPEMVKRRGRVPLSRSNGIGSMDFGFGRGAERRSLRTAGGGRFGMVPPPRMRSLRAEVSADVGHFQAAWQVELPQVTRGASCHSWGNRCAPALVSARLHFRDKGYSLPYVESQAESNSAGSTRWAHSSREQ